MCREGAHEVNPLYLDDKQDAEDHGKTALARLRKGVREISTALEADDVELTSESAREILAKLIIAQRASNALANSKETQVRDSRAFREFDKWAHFHVIRN